MTAAEPRPDLTTPVIVLTYAYSGAEHLERLLSGGAAFACTAGTGLLPLCDLATVTWRKVENRDGALSQLAARSVRAMVSTLSISVLAGTGRSRWCEISFAPADSAQSFLEVYPAAKFLCLHRSCVDVVRASVLASPWGLMSPAFQPFSALYPGNSVAAVAAYWVTCTEALLDFEKSHPGSCWRIRYEELTGNPVQAGKEISAFLGLEQDDLAGPDGLDGGTVSPDGAGYGSRVPVGQIPPPLRARADQLLTGIGYPPMTASPSKA